MVKKYYSYFFIVPLLIIYIMLFLVPAVMGLLMSFTDWTRTNGGVFNAKFVGLYQFKSLYEQIKLMGIDGDVGRAFANTFIYGFTVMVVQNIIGLALALVLNLPFKTKGFMRSAFFLPCIFSSIIITFTFSAILFPGGPLDSLLNSMGLGEMIKPWLTDKSINIFVISGINIWMFIGFAATIYLAGLKSIPGELSEAAKIDGTTSLQNFKYITFPLIAPAITINMVMSLVGSLKTFDLPYLLSGTLCYVINTIVYDNFAQKGLYAYGTSISVILFIIICSLALPLLRILRKREVEL